MNRPNLPELGIMGNGKGYNEDIAKTFSMQSWEDLIDIMKDRGIEI